MIRLALFILLIQTNTQLLPLEHFYEQAISFIKAEDYEAAIEKLEAIYGEEPSHVPTIFNLALCLSDTGRLEKAIELYREALDLDPGLFEAQMNLAMLLHESGKIEQALETFERASKIAPNDPVPVIYRARELDQMERQLEAEQAYLAALRIDNGLPSAWEALGFLYRRMGRNQDARSALLKAEELGVKSPSLFVNLGDLSVEQRELKTAKQYFEKAHLLAANDSDVQLRLALVLRDLEEFPGAISLLKNLPEAHEALAEAYFASKDYSNSAIEYEALVEKDLKNSKFWYLLGRSLFEMDRREEAIPYLQKSLTLEPTRVGAWGTLAAIHYSEEDWLSTISMLLKYLELDPEHAPSHFAIATSYDNLRDFEKALLHYNKFTELDDGSNDVRSFQVRQRIKVLQQFL